MKDSDLQSARERIKENLNTGKTIKDQLKEAKRITSGIVFKCNTTRLGQTVFEACKENQMKKKEEEKKKMRKDKEDYDQMVIKAKEIFARKQDVEMMTIRELTTICKPHKLKSDGKMPNKKKDLIEAWNAWKNRPPPVFESDDTVSITSDGDDDMLTAIDCNDETSKKNDLVLQTVEI